MKFQELTTSAQIVAIKNQFVQLMCHLSTHPTELSNYIKVEKPAVVAPTLIKLDDLVGDAKTEAEKHNQLQIDNASKKNIEAEVEFLAKQESFKKALKKISSFEKLAECMCGECINLDMHDSIIPEELEPIIDFARKQAQDNQY